MDASFSRRLGIFLLILANQIIKTEGLATCGGPKTYGPPNTEDEITKGDVGNTVDAVLLDHADYQFDCCGFIDAWEIYTAAPIGTVVYLQVWEDVGTIWNRIGETAFTTTVTAAADNQKVTTRIKVGADANPDFIGFYSPNGYVIPYGNGHSYRKAKFPSAQTSYNWDGETLENNGDFAIHAEVVPSIPPTINLDDTVIVANTDPGGTVVFTLVATDPDPEDAGILVYTHTGSTGSAATLFSFSPTTQQVTVEYGVTMTPGDHTMSFSVSDGCDEVSTGTLTLRIINEPPVITSLPADTTISEDLAVKTLLHTLVVVDGDATAIICSLVTTGVPFSVEQVSGSTDWAIYYDATSTMDFYTRNAYVLTVSCTDTYDSVTGEFTVNLVLNQPPVINSLPLAVDVSEDTLVETTIYTVSVTDPENVDVTCTVPTITPATTLLLIKPNANKNEFDFILASGGGLNYDSVRTYRMDLTCSDERRSDSNVFFVNVLRNQPPLFVNLQNTTAISSISSYIGQIVFDVDVTDRENDQVTYSMTCVPATNCPFQIYHSGEIVLTRSVAGEFVPAYDIYVTVNDGKTSTGPRSLTVHILDINYVPVITNLPLPSSLVVSENVALGLSVYQISVQDNDQTDTHTYTMTSSPSTGMLYFAIDPSSGLVKTSATNNINYEEITPTTTFTLIITVTDSKDSSSKNLAVTIADVNEPPVFTKKFYVLSTNEGAAGTVLQDPGYLYTDDDPGDTHKFSMVCGSNVGFFTIAPTTGIISLATNLDVDAAGMATSYTCTVTVSDGTLMDTATLTINVININDNTPAFASNLYTYYLDINTAVNTVFGSAVATDGDIGAFGTFTYSIDQSSLSTDTFGIKSNGDLYLKSSLTSYGYGKSLKFTALATDTGTLQGSATVFVVIPQTTTTTTTTTDRMVTFIEYPPNVAWLIVAIILGLVILSMPMIILFKTNGPCTWKGRPDGTKEYSDLEEVDEEQPKARRGAVWNPWKWYQIRKG